MAGGANRVASSESQREPQLLLIQEDEADSSTVPGLYGAEHTAHLVPGKNRFATKRQKNGERYLPVFRFQF